MESTDNPKPIIHLSRVSVNYSSVKALNDISLAINAGERHAIIGEHGAGKSSLGMVLSGMISPTSGKIFLNNSSFSSYSMKTAQKAGIRMVYQENLLNEYFSVAENILYKSSVGTHFGFYSTRRINEHASRYLSDLGFKIDARTEVIKLTLSERTVVEILKVLYTNPRVLILDESLEKLSNEHYKIILPLLQEKCEQGMALIVITHKIDDVFQFANKITVLKEGTFLITETLDNVNKLNLIRMAYTQVGVDSQSIELDTVFYQILKYNEAILQFLPMNLIVIDGQMIIKMVNEQCISNFNLAGKEYLNTPIANLLRESKIALELIEEAVRSEETRSFYNVEIRLQKRTTINNIKTIPVFDGLAVLGTVLIIEDISEYDSMQRQLILSERLAAVGMLAAGVAHEINNPLEIISNYLSYLKYTQSNTEVIEAVDKVHNEISHISKIISNLLTFSDRKSITKTAIDINRVIEDILQLLKYNAKFKDIDIQFEKEQEQQYFIGDEGQLKQIMLNLLKNSFEAMPTGGIIHIHSSVEIVNGNTYSTIIFEDDGPGIEEEDLDSIFLPFFSTKSGKKDQLGLGLGLAITYRLIESLKGNITVANKEPTGCRFKISLPFTEGD